MVTTSTVPSVRRLAQYRPFARGGLDLEAVLQDLVMAAAAINDGPMESTFACKTAFSDLWNLEVEVDELRPAIDSLIRAGKLAKAGSKGFRLSGETAAELRDRAREWEETEQRAFREWEVAVRRLRPQLLEEEMESLGADLRSWLHQIISRHGAEAAMMLYPEQERARKFFEILDARGFEELPERAPELAAVREQALPLFIRCATVDQREFLAGLLNTSFYMCVLTIDPEAKHLVQGQMKGQRIYADTNFLYAVLGAAPPQEVYSSRRLVQMCRELGFEIAYTPWTANELRTSIAASRRLIERQGNLVRPELAAAMLRLSGDKGFTRFFWQIYNDKGTKPADVFDRLEHFDGDLEDYGIKVVTAGCDRVERQHERIQEYASLLNRERWPEQREWVVLEHDAKCRLLVEQLRGVGNIRVSNARFWFLTYDGKLPRFAKRVPDNGDEAPELPFCISPSAWLQVVRALTPRTGDFDRAVVDLLTSPFVTYRRAVDPELVQEVIGRMDLFEDASPEMAVAVLTDTAKVGQIEEAIASKDEDAIENAIGQAYNAKAREMEEAVAASEARAREIEETLAKTESRLVHVQSTHEQAHAAYQQAEEQWQAERAELEGQLAQAKEGRETAERSASARISQLEQRLEKDDQRRKRNQLILMAAGLIALGLVIGVVLPLGVITGKWGVAGAAVAGFGLVLIGIRILLPPRLAGEFWLWGAVLAGAAAAAAAIAGVVPGH